MQPARALLLAILLAGCGGGGDAAVVDPPAPPPTAQSLAVVSGNGQSGTVARALAQPLVVRVIGTGGVALAGQTVSFAVAQGGGSLSGATATTDAQGQAQVTWTLGTAAGAQSVTASLGSLPPASFSATAVADEPAKVVLTTSPSATAGIGVRLTTQPTAALQDRHGNPVARAGVSLSASVTTSGVTLSGTTTATTSAAGTATFTDLSLSGPPGAVTLSVGGTGLTAATATTTLAWTRTFAVTPLALMGTGAIPNAAYLPGENRVVLIYSASNGHAEVTSTDGVTFANFGTTTSKFTDLMRPLSLGGADIIVREKTGGGRRYFLKGTRGSNARPIHVYAADQAAGGTGALTLLSTTPVYQGSAADSADIGVMDIIETRTSGTWRMFYVARVGVPGNSRTAVSTDQGRTWTPENDNPFGDKSLPATAQNMNVDPAPLRLADGTYMAVTMRGGKLFFFNSWDGLTFTEVAGFSVSATEWSAVAPNRQMFFDPTLVQLPNGKIYMYVTVGGPTGVADALASAEITIR